MCVQYGVALIGKTGPAGSDPYPTNSTTDIERPCAGTLCQTGDLSSGGRRYVRRPESGHPPRGTSGLPHCRLPGGISRARDARLIRHQPRGGIRVPSRRPSSSMYCTERRETPRRRAAVATLTPHNPLGRDPAKGGAGFAVAAANFFAHPVCVPALLGRTPRTEDACASPADAGARHAVPLRPLMPPPGLPLRFGFTFRPRGVVARPLPGPPRFGFLPWPEHLVVPSLAGRLIFRLTATLQEVSCYDCPIPPDAMPPGAPERGGRPPHPLADFGERRSPRRLWRLAALRSGADRDARAAPG